MNELMIFEGHEVEAFELNGQVMFNPYHVGACLELGNEAVRKSMSRMNDKQVIKVKNSDVTSSNIRKLNNAGENFITESGVYKLVFKSRKPNAEAFTDWVADEVLPSLRKTGSYKVPMQKKEVRTSLASVNMAAKNIMKIYEEAGVDPKFTAVAVNTLYKEQAGIDLILPIKTEEPKLYDCTEIAKELGIMSLTGNSHNMAVSAIIQKLHIPDDVVVTTPFTRNGHSDFTVQYKPYVFEQVKLWIVENGYPTKVHYQDGGGKHKTYSVVYREVA